VAPTPIGVGFGGSPLGMEYHLRLDPENELPGLTLVRRAASTAATTPRSPLGDSIFSTGVTGSTNNGDKFGVSAVFGAKGTVKGLTVSATVAVPGFPQPIQVTITRQPDRGRVKNVGMMARTRKAATVAATVLIVFVLAGCAAAANSVTTPPGGHVAGFWLGLWHGFICPITLIVSWFSDSIGIYDVHNNGGWYDFGFVLGASIFFGSTRGPSAARRRRRPREVAG
jgi:hypothetical protein